MSSRDDQVTKVLKESYGRGLTWERYAALTQGASPVWQGLRYNFSRMRAFFEAQQGDGSTFQYWTDDWSTGANLNVMFPHLFALSMNPGATVAECWDGTWTPTLARALSD